MNKAFTEILAGLNDAVAHAKGELSGVVEHNPERLNVKAIREQTGMTEQHFCATFGISLTTLRHWENGSSKPRGTARVLLKLVAKDPQAAISAAKEYSQ
ncbi:Antitoxin HigA-2 [Anaerolineae bacterium]|nr:Antitoxin HigA-2 [Anaerolineae bacterium]